MNNTRYRVQSPDTRQLVDPMRASTGNIPVDPGLDPYYPRSSQGYNGHQQLTFADNRGLHQYYPGYHQPRRSPLANDDWKPEVRQIAPKPYLTPEQAAPLQPQHVMRPRSNTSSAADSRRRPLSVVIPSSPNRNRFNLEGSRSPRRTPYYTNDSDRYILPASSTARHRRIVSSEDRGPRSATVGDRSAKGRKDRTTYLAGGSGSGPGPRKGYLTRPSGGKAYHDIDTHNAYSYTNAKEQFYRDSDAIRDRRRQDLRKKERPLSLTGLEKYLPQPPPKERKEGGTTHSKGPQAAEKSEKDEKRRASGKQEEKEKEIPRTSEMVERRTSRLTPVSLHQERNMSPSYREAYDDFEDPWKYLSKHDVDDHTREDSSRDSKQQERYPRVNRDRKATRDASSGLATAGLASGYLKDSRRRGGHESDASPRAASRKPRRAESKQRGDEKPARHASPDSGSDEYIPDAEMRRYLRRAKDSRKNHADVIADVRRDRYAHDSKAFYSDSSDQERPTRRQQEKMIADDDSLLSTSADGSDERQKRLRIVDSPSSREGDVAPKSILKQPTEKFPEDPNAIREGVAPLKDAIKKGIPSGARWTKIDRKLVNPAALEGHERFEERSDYVIVLRVLSKDEIQEYALRTAEIRCKFSLADIHNVHSPVHVGL